MKSHLTLLVLITFTSAIQIIPSYAAEDKKATRLQLRKKFRNAKALYEKRKKAGAPATELTKLEEDMKKARRQYIGAIIGITAAVVAATAAAVKTSKLLKREMATDDLLDAATPGEVQQAIASGAKVNVRDLKDHTPLYNAVMKNRITVVEELLKNGADPNPKPSTAFLSASARETPLHIASARGYDEMVRLLLDYHAALEARDWIGLTPLHVASRDGRFNIVKLLLDKGAHVNATRAGNGGITPLHYAIYQGVRYTALHPVGSYQDYKDIVKLLLDKGANVNATTTMGSTPLHLASYQGYEDMVKLLLDHGAKVNVKNLGGFTALDMTNNEKIKAILKQHNALPGDKKEQQEAYQTYLRTRPGEFLL